MAWAQRAEVTGAPVPAAVAAGVALPGLVIDTDASIVVSHSEKESATATFKSTFGYHPIFAFLDNSGEFLAGLLRPGNAGANTAADHITVLAGPEVQPRLRPVHHHREDRIRDHVQLCWLALLLLRVVENATDDTWRNIRHELDRMHLITLSTADGQVAQRSATTAGQKAIFTALELPEPTRFLDFTVPGTG